MQKHYKIITRYSYFSKIYTVDDSLYIPFGTKVIASSPFVDDYETRGIENGHYYIEAEEPVIHFCDNAFDTMLWHNTLSNLISKTLLMESAIYEIKPLTKVIKQRCNDDVQLYQCGANMIEFLARVPADTMYERALSEFHQNHHAKIDMYPNLQMSKIISAWVNHNRSKYVC
jgi:hypothetical protein